MQILNAAPIPANEEFRLIDLGLHEIMDSAPEVEYDDLMELASQLCNCPIASISFVDGTRQWFKSRKGLEDQQTSRAVAFCAHTILQQSLLIVEDASKDERFFDNPNVTGGLGIRFYAGAPITSAAGNNLGTICVIDQKQRRISEDQQKILTVIARQIGRLLELRLKNIILNNHAHGLLELERLTVKHAMREQDNERLLIRQELYEHYAQVLAALSVNLDMAETVPELRVPLIQKTKLELRKLLSEVTQFSDQISPESSILPDGSRLVSEFIDPLSKRLSLKSTVTAEGNFQKIDPAQVHGLTRLIQQSLEILKDAYHCKDIFMELKITKTINLIIHYKGLHTEKGSHSRSAVFNMLLRRVELYQGTLFIVSERVGENKLIFCLPLKAAEKKLQ